MKTSADSMTRDTTPPAAGTAAATRRDFLRGLGGAVVVGTVLPGVTADAAAALPAVSPLAMAISDRGVGLRQQPSVFAFARQCGVRGAEVDLGRLGTSPDLANRLLDPAVRGQFLDAARDSGVAISSLALSAFADQSFATHTKADDFADDLLYLLRECGVRVGLLPIDAENDYTRGRSIERLKRLAPTAERDGLVLAIDAPNLSATGLRDVLDAVGSPAVQAVITAGPDRDAAADLAVLGRARVAQVRYRHDNEADASAELAAFARVLAATGYDGWVVIDRPAMAADDEVHNVRVAADRVNEAFLPAFA